MRSQNAFTLQISTNGQISAIYYDELAGLCKQGTTVIVRASHVEPTENGQGWCADMYPVGGPVLGPFATRGEALDAEVQYLDELLFDVEIHE